jgi:hypothetical protein
MKAGRIVWCGAMIFLTALFGLSGWFLISLGKPFNLLEGEEFRAAAYAFVYFLSSAWCLIIALLVRKRMWEMK